MTLATPPPSPGRRSFAREFRKDASFRLLMSPLGLARLARLGRTRRCAIECYPGLPNHKEVIWKVAFCTGARLLAYRGDRGRAAADRPLLRLYWGGDTAAAPGDRLPPAPEWRRALNAGLLDTGKRNVAAVFARAFGYGLAVDPRTHEGPCVAKSDRNSAHDGRVLDCPTSRVEAGTAYELLVDNRSDERTVVDIRVPVVGGEMPFVYLKYRPLGDRFRNANSRVEIAPTGRVLSRVERARIRAFCRAIGLDLGELDVLRDAADGRIYIVDVNHMPFGPPRPMRPADASRALRSYGEALLRLAERPAAATHADSKVRPS